MTSSIRRGFGKLGQRTGELLGHGSGSKADVGDDFKDLQLETDNRHAGTECTQAALLQYVNQMLKRKDASDNSKLKLYMLENLGSSMIRLGSSLPKDSNYGRALESLGQTEEKLNELQLEYVNSVKENWLPELQRSLDDFKQYVAMQKKLEARRSEYDSKMVKFQKARKDNITIEDELRTAQVRYEDQYDDLAHRMMEMQDAEQEYLRGAFSFYQAQMEYHRKSYEELTRISGAFDDCLRAQRAPAAERHPIGALMATRKSQQALKPTETTTATRHPIPFDGAGTNPLARSASYRTAPGHARNNSSSQFSDRGIPSSGMAPQLARTQSEFAGTPPAEQGGSGPPTPGRGVPTTAPRRHAPPPPTPARGPPKQLRKTLYQFQADDPGELALEKNDIVEVLEQIDDGWWKGKLLHSPAGNPKSRIGATGLFPANYTKEHDGPVPAPAAAGGGGGGTRPSVVHQRVQSFQSAGYKPPSAYRSPSAPKNELRLKTSTRCWCNCENEEPHPLKDYRCRNCDHFHNGTS
ncbi:hypothetical protein GGF46_002150 [Coemansia sp. RSA 552]|nr:hypothetical protein GGF46_002150 [Coemansia sp. RSA 552]